LRQRFLPGKNRNTLFQLPLLNLLNSQLKTNTCELFNNLDEIYYRLNCRYFQGSVRVQIHWGRYGRRPRRPRRRTIRLGAYFFESKTIRIHPVLAQDWVPKEVLESVIFHEMCHAVEPFKTGPRKRRCHHHEEFRNIEQKFEHHERAAEWIKKNLDRLIKHRKQR
jgi:predicted SprT family Zn-dependent metalloprotease